MHNLLKEKVAQSSTKDQSTKLFNRGSYTLRILFILFFWDTDKQEDGNYIHLHLDFFEYEESVLSEFHSYIISLILPIIFMCLYHIFKIILFNDKNQLLFFIFNITIIFQCFFTIFYPIDKTENSNALNEDYFSNTGCKYIELIAYLIIIVLLIIDSLKKHIKNLIRKKFSPKNGKNVKFSIIIVIASFIINLIGYVSLIFLLFFFTFNEINEDLEIEKYYYYWKFLFASITLILAGYSFIFGHFCYNLIY